MAPFDFLWLLLPLAAASGWLVGHFGMRRRESAAAADDLRSNYFKGINYLLNEQPDKAIEAFIKVLEVDSETVETHLALGNLYRRRGEVDRAIRIHQNLIARPNLESEQRSEALLELGHDYLSAGLLDRAENLLQELADSGDYRVQALRQLIDIYEQEKDWDKAIDSARLLEKATGNHLSPVVAHYQCEIAERFRQSDDVDQALELVKKALGSHERCVRASILEGDILTDLQEHERAIRAYQRVEEQDADYVPETIERIQYCYRALEKPEEMDAYLNGLMDRYGWITPMLALADMKQDREGAEEGRRVLYGVRPEHWSLTGEGDGLAAEVVVVEPTGSETLVVCKMAGGEIQAAFRERHDFKPGQMIRLRPELEVVHLFDAEKGARIV